MKNIIFLSLVLISCNQLFITEDDALKKNEEAVLLLNQGKPEKAAILFKEAINTNKLSTANKENVYRNLAQTYIQLELKDSAIYYFGLAAKCFDKGSFNFLINTADIDLLKGKTNIALKKLLKAYAMRPYELNVNNSLGLIYLGEYDYEFQNLELALPYNKKAFEINNDRITEYVLAKNYLDLGQFEKAEKHFTNLNNNYPDIISHPLGLGLIKFKLNDKKEAEKLWATVLQKDSTYKETIEAYKEGY